MHSLFLDTNILLDAFVSSRLAHKEAFALLDFATMDEGTEQNVLSSCLKDVYCIFARHYGAESQAREIVAATREMATVVSLTDATLGAALASDEPDLEDAMVRVAAETSGADLLVTRDAEAYLSSSLRKADAGEALRVVM